MGLLDSLIGGAVGAGLAVAAEKFIDQHGGVEGIAAQLKSHGLGDTVKSWIASGPNQPISADHLQQVFGSGTLEQMAQRCGMTTEEFSAHMSHLLPKAVDHLTPDGVIAPPAAPQA
jgi:uncharacterized protein YidB (DUF937 family)